MKRLVPALIIVGLMGCQGETTSLKGNNEPVNPDQWAPCTDPSTCCTNENRVCVGDPDTGMICGCSGLWDCSKNPKKCDQPLPTPDGGAGWKCSWNEFRYVCEKDYPEGPGETPPGGGDWTCNWKDKEFTWECTKNVTPNPTNKPEGTGVWKCTIEENTLVCERTDEGVPPAGGGEWRCETGPKGNEVCHKEDSNGGLPEGGGNWKCNKTTENGVPVWVCYGESETPPGGGNWTCVEVEGEFNTWKCEKSEEGGDVPPGGGWWACVKGSEFGGTECEKVPNEPLPPTPTSNGVCTIGEKMWCDGLQYCGWGQVACDPATGKWKTKLDPQGKEILDCQELADGGRPNTVCACYHFYYNPGCCERPDCIVPTGTTPQQCPPSKGGLCDYCNPQKSECTEPGARCVVTNSHETFCGRECSAANPCPDQNAYKCQPYKLQGGITVHQCVPIDFSCYY